MPSGRTHDRITIWALPVIVGATFWHTRNGNITLLIATGFMLGGLMFGPDLDIHSVQYQRWGWFRWIWYPYQKSLRHRSFLSHGPIIGTTFRVVYFTLILSIVVVTVLVIAEKLGNVTLNWQMLANEVGNTILSHKTEFLALFLGLEFGAMSHYLSDWTGSTYKRIKKQGIRAYLNGLSNSGKIKKRKPTIRKGKGQRLKSKGKQ
ncbi:MAG: metal-binding protein [Calothrix sp. C42_A2020_038]|nr:metal-binding protein [Calothrix sp. C42_A2020_038]